MNDTQNFTDKHTDIRNEGRAGICGAIMVCHPPIIIPGVGKGEEKKIADISDAYAKAAKTVCDLDPDTVVIVSPHAPSYIDYIQLTSAPRSRGSLADFNDPNDTFAISNDTELVRKLESMAKKEDFAMGTLGSQNGPLDHGTMVPLYFLKDLKKDVKIVRMSVGGLSHLDHYKAGMMIAKAAIELGKRVAIVASGDLSHCQKAGTHYGYKECGPAYDRKIMEIMSQADFEALVAMPQSEAEEAMSCGHNAFCIMAGALDGFSVQAEALAHSAVFGVGYGICTYTNLREDKSRKLYEKMCRDAIERRVREKAQKDAYVRLAWDTVEAYVKTGRLPEKRMMEQLEASACESMEKERAGVFVSIHENGNLRGCIGTILPVHENIAREIMENAIAACSRDPRFPSVREDELDHLEYHVDVLSKPEVCQKKDLDVSKYGVIVTSRSKRGVLLPDLEGVDTVEDQIRIAKQKAGISNRDLDVVLERFEVVRHQ